MNLVSKGHSSDESYHESEQEQSENGMELE